MGKNNNKAQHHAEYPVIVSKKQTSFMPHHVMDYAYFYPVVNMYRTANSKQMIIKPAFALKAFFMLMLLFHQGALPSFQNGNADSSPGFGYPYCHGSELTDYEFTPFDMTTYGELIRLFPERAPSNAAVGEIITGIGLSFLGTPYVASTLDMNDEEVLVVNLRGMDCVTFVEYVLAAALTYRAGQTDFFEFAKMVRCLRYRAGIIEGYASRLHYFTDWLTDNSLKGIISVISNDLGSATMDTTVNFMSSNPHLYRHLSDTDVLNQVRQLEQELSGQTFRYIPKEEILRYEDDLQNGDILAFVTRIEGLDVSHTGFALHTRGRLHLLHASSRSGKVEISEKPLHEYLKGQTSVKGILAGRVR
ncbi:MAG: DUF1460 domain-containing protein [Bacteroidales bacterium]|nr:DUF1460 domain-containing protein [Bacteroidales bacterium]